ncbi:hypothetical protein TD95_003049 [Thielaviopsis punctulata]|uniref:Major facilitator superfamily (MFS) profile domain-containing protein n=1 Tax=Thielaviopsis punctulata TaxID=72032 RepID=A0A0F4ZD33_9PEZI|nr:hypothetical protein TD95_003049 [Thielaviopsis punctulata]
MAARSKLPSGPGTAFPFMQLFLLAVVRLAEPIALTSIFPYAWALVKHFNVGNEQTASFYAGLLISAFSLAEASMGMFWGSLSDRIGRKPVLMMGSLGTTISLAIVGFSSNIWMAVFGRALGGFLNGNIGVIQTMVGEMVTNPAHEPRAYAVLPFVWTAGTIIGPAIGGSFANPHHSFPAVFGPDSLFARFPFLLPNLVCASLLFLSVVMGYFLLQETHPEIVARSNNNSSSSSSSSSQPGSFEGDVSEETSLLDGSSANYGLDGSATHYGFDDGAAELSEKADSDEPPQRIFTSRVVSLIVCLSIFTYHSMTFDHLLPIFLEDARADVASRVSSISSPLRLLLAPGPGGLGLTVRSVGMIMAVDGLIALFIQAVIFPLAAEFFGIFRLFLMVVLVHPVAYVIMPALLFVPQQYIYPAIYTCLTIRDLLSILLYPLLLILIKDATVSGSTALGKVNGLAASAGAACRMIAPPIAGFLYTWGSSIDCTAVAWYGSVFVACIGSVQVLWVKRPQAARHM